MPTTIIRTGCKINLYLRVGARRPDGYHELDTLFLPLAEPHDLLKITPLDSGSGESAQAPRNDRRREEDRSVDSAAPGLTVVCDTPGIDPLRNTLTKAYAVFAQATGFAPALRVVLTKGVPHGAGLGGGSANAAGLFRYLQNRLRTLEGTALSEEALLQLAAKTGADVPFFLLGQPAAATGIGEKLTPCANPFGGQFLVLLCPALRVSTAWAFAALDESREENKNFPAKTLTTERHRATTPFAYGASLENDFTEVVFRAFPELSHLHRELLECGAHAAGLSGTGSSLFGFFPGAAQAKSAARMLGVNCPEVYVQSV